MKYIGDLYAKIGRKYIKLEQTSDDVDRITEQLTEAKVLIRNWIDLVCNKLSEGCPGCEHCLFGDIKSHSDIFLKEIEK